MSSAVADERAAASAALDSANERLAALCQSHSATFVAVERRNQEIAAILQKLRDQLPATETTRAILSSSSSSSSSNGGDDNNNNNHGNRLAELTERHRVRRRTLLQHGSLLELLELPVILDACIRSQMYDEALQIAAFAAQQLQSKNDKSNDSVIIRNVVEEIRLKCQDDLRHHLLGRLKEAVSMPECLEVITAIRRLNTIDLESNNTTTTIMNLEEAHERSEYKLAVDFLEARDLWLELGTSATNNGTGGTGSKDTTGVGTTGLMMDVMEAYRTRVFAIATQFTAIFRSSATLQYEPLLALWLSRRIQRYLALLQQQHSGGLGSCVEIRDALEAVLFFGSSLGRLGADFTALLDLKPALVQTVGTPWRRAVQQFTETLQICRDAMAVGPLQSEAATTTDVGGEDDDSSPPKILLQVPPLARLVNGILEGLNELRRCLLPDAFVALRRELHQVLNMAADALRDHQRAAFGSLRQNAAALSDFYRTIADPYCRGALETTLGYEARAKTYYQTMRLGIAAATKVDDEPPAVVEEENQNDDANDGEEVKVSSEEAAEEDSQKAEQLSDQGAPAEVVAMEVQDE